MIAARGGGIPRGVWVLGGVSLCMDMSSELVHALLPLYMSTLGASVLFIGIVEGIAEAIALVVKLFSGVLSDWFRRRKPLLLLGYGLGAISKVAFPLTTSLGVIVGARFADRVGKGIRGAPRDALLADITPKALRGRGFGLRQALDTVGAITGPLLALAGMAMFAGNFQAVLWIAVIPAIACILLIVLGIDEPPRRPADGKPRLRWSDRKRLPPVFWMVVTIAAVLTLARFSEAFLLLRGQDAGMSAAHAPLVMVAMTIVYAVTAYPAGIAADRGKGPSLLAVGLAALLAADLVLAHAGTPAAVVAGAALWGLHMGLTQGLQSALVAGAAPEDLRGTAFGVFNLVCGVALLCASTIAGWLWDSYGPAVTFYAGAAFTVLAGFGLVWRRADVRAFTRSG